MTSALVVCGSKSLAVMWLRFLDKQDVLRLRSTCLQSKADFEDVDLLVSDSFFEEEEEVRHIEFETCSESSPRILYASDFLLRIECRALIALEKLASRAADDRILLGVGSRRIRNKRYLQADAIWFPDAMKKLMRRIETRISTVTGCGTPQQSSLELHFTPSRREDDRPRLDTLDGRMWMCSENGAHVDVNNGYPHRYVTALVYLNDVERGGATCFPAVEASRTLLEKGFHHTDAAFRTTDDENVFDDACAVVAAASTLADGRVESHNGKGFRFQPVAGGLCLFWSLDDDGLVDPYSFHAGARVLSSRDDDDEQSKCQGKWTLQSFRQLPTRCRLDDQAKTSFLRASRRRLAGGSRHLRFSTMGDTRFK